jgi:hypothetical protein
MALTLKLARIMNNTYYRKPTLQLGIDLNKVKQLL